MNDFSNHLRRIASRGYTTDSDNQELFDCADEIERLRAVLDAIDALHQPDYEYPDECTECDFAWPCDTNLLIHSQEARRG